MPKSDKPWKLVEMNRHFPWLAERTHASYDTVEEAAVALNGERAIRPATVVGPDGKPLLPCDVDALVVRRSGAFMVYLLVDQPDEKGKQHFWGFWKGLVGRGMGEDGVRGQYFRANIESYKHDTTLSGDPRRVEVFDLREMGVSEQVAMERCRARVRAVTGMNPEGAVSC